MIFKKILIAIIYFFAVQIIVLLLCGINLIGNNYNTEIIFIFSASLLYIYRNFRENIPIIKDEKIKLIFILVIADLVSFLLFFILALYREGKLGVINLNSFNSILLAPFLLKLFFDIVIFMVIISIANKLFINK